MKIIKEEDLDELLDWIDDQLTPEFPNIQDHHLEEAIEFLKERGYKILRD